MSDKLNIKTLCRIQQDCGGCEAFNEAFRQFSENCEFRKVYECQRADNNVPHCCAANCPIFDRENILNDD